MTALRLAFLLLSSTTLLAACDSAAPIVAPPSTTSEPPVVGKLPETSPTTLLVVADDADTADGAALRAHVAESVRGGLANLAAVRSGTCGTPDPAAWIPQNVRVLVARPSAPDGTALLTPLDSPALAWVTETSTPVEMTGVVTAAAGALAQRLAQPGDVYRPLHTAQRALELVTGARAPESDAETAVVASLPAGSITMLLVASTRDDEDPTPVANLVPATAPNAVDYVHLAGPFTASAGTCQVVTPGTTRLETWAHDTQLVELYTSSCTDDDTWDRLLFDDDVDCAPQCRTFPLPVTPAGVTSCTIFMDQADLTTCDPTHGWRDPGGQPTFVEQQGEKLRRCEVIQLSGAELQSCRDDLACPGCASGWCTTEVPALTPTPACQGGTYPWALRFVGGAKVATDGTLTVTCDAPTE